MTITVYTPRPGSNLVQIDPVDTMLVPLEMCGATRDTATGSRFCVGIAVDDASYKEIMRAWGGVDGLYGILMELPNGETVVTPSPAGKELAKTLEEIHANHVKASKR